MNVSIGIDIGGTKCALSVGDCTTDAVRILHREEFPTRGMAWQEVLEEFASRINRTIEQSNNRIKVPVHLQNDANACAYAEWKFGAGRGTRNMVFMTFGAGLSENIGDYAALAVANMED